MIETPAVEPTMRTASIAIHVDAVHRPKGQPTAISRASSSEPRLKTYPARNALTGPTGYHRERCSMGSWNGILEEVKATSAPRRNHLTGNRGHPSAQARLRE